MTASNPTETPHPLEVEAAENLAQRFTALNDTESCQAAAQIIHTTALEPVLKAGESLHEFLEAYHGEGNPPCRKDCQVCQALTQWRTLTSPETGDSCAVEAPRSDFDANLGSGQRADAWKAMAERLATDLRDELHGRERDSLKAFDALHRSDP